MGQIQEFTQDAIAIGRDTSCHVRFPADLSVVSRKHAEILREGNRFKLVDHSANGTLVNGKKAQEVYLKDGDVLTFSEGGPKVSFLSQVQEAPAEEQPVESPPLVIRDREPQLPQAEVKSRHPAASPRLAVEAAAQARRDKVAAVEVKNVSAPLIIQYGPTLRSFKELPVVVGRHPRSDFILEHPAVLDQHLQIFFAQDAYWVKDLTGLQHVTVNGKPVAGQVALQPQDELALTASGPFFLFLGAGRLAEKEAPAGGAVPGAEQPGQGAEEPAPSKDRQGKKSFFRKILGE